MLLDVDEKVRSASRCCTTEGRRVWSGRGWTRYLEKGLVKLFETYEKATIVDRGDRGDSGGRSALNARFWQG